MINFHREPLAIEGKTKKKRAPNARGSKSSKAKCSGGRGNAPNWPKTLQMEKDYYVFNGVQGEDGKPSRLVVQEVVKKKGNPQTDNPWKDVKGSQQGTFQLEVGQQVWLHGVYNFKHGFYPVCSIEENKSFRMIARSSMIASPKSLRKTQVATMTTAKRRWRRGGLQ